MASSPHTCPECRARLDSSRARRDGKVRCPDCGALVASMRDDDSDDGITSRPGRPVARGSRNPRRHRDDEDDSPVRKKGPSLAGPILVGVALGLLGLCLIGGGVAGFLWLRPAAADEVAQAEDGGLDPIKPVAAVNPGLEPIKAGPGAKGAVPLQELKAASVYIKAITPNVGGATGSGFVVRSVGDSAWVVTNHHVIAPLKPDEMPGRRRPPFGPAFRRPQWGGPVEVTVVFRSGMPQEQSLRAAIVKDEATDDLAVLKVTGLKDPPRPIDCNRAPELIETMPVLAFGFPFGAELDPEKANPAITVTKGAVSSIRKNRRGELTEVQIDGDVNPGNSGGPLVDETGALVGVVVAKIDKSRIGFAVPVHKLNRLLAGPLEPQAAAPPAAGGNPPPQANAAPPANPVPPPARPSRPPAGEDLTKLLADLKSPDAPTRQQAAEVLAQAPPRSRRAEAAAAARALLGDAEPAVRTAAAKVLAACDRKEAAPPLAKLLDDPSPLVRQTVTGLLKDLKDARVAEAVAARLATPEPLPAVDVLKAMGPAAEKAVLPYLDDKYAGPTRFWAFNVLGEIGGPDSLPALEKVTGPDALHARGAIQAVRQRVPLTKDEWPKALDDLKSADDAGRTAAARRIAATPPVEDRRADVVSRLETVLNDQSGDVRIAAIKGLARWGGKAAVPTLAKRLEGFDPGAHAVVIDVLAELGGDEAAAAIAKRVPDVFDRPKAVQALKAMDPPVAEKVLLPLLEGGGINNVFTRLEVIKVLADVGGKDSIAPLERLANDPDVHAIHYRGAAQEALAAIKERVEDEKK